jgi:2,4'-dihydroxyacetophenone dioxygenase
MSDTLRPTCRFDDAAVTWRPFPDYDGLSFWVLNVNETRQKVDLLFRFAPGARCPVHRHVGPTDTFVLEGEHRTYELTDDGWRLDQERPPGTFAPSEGDHVHYEQGGPEGAIIALAMQAVDGVIWEVLDDEGAITDITTLADFRRALDRQEAAATSPR